MTTHTASEISTISLAPVKGLPTTRYAITSAVLMVIMRSMDIPETRIAAHSRLPYFFLISTSRVNYYSQGDGPLDPVPSAAWGKKVTGRQTDNGRTPFVGGPSPFGICNRGVQFSSLARVRI